MSDFNFVSALLSVLSVKIDGGFKVNSGRPPTASPPVVVLIAAQARSLGATLITANAGEFKRINGLKAQAWR